MSEVRKQLEGLELVFSSEEWDNIKREILVCLNNADKGLKSKDCSDRSWYAGKCAAFDEILGLERIYAKIKIKK